MKILKRAALALLTLGLAAGAALPAATANAEPAHRAPLTVAYFTNGGNNNGLGGNLTAGDPVVQTIAPGIHVVFSNDTSYLGDPAGTLRTTAGTFVAANSACNGLTFKSLSSSNGTVWGDHVTASGLHQLDSRYCSQNGGQGDLIVAWADNTINHQWHLCDNGPLNVDCGTGKFWNLQRNVF